MHHNRRPRDREPSPGLSSAIVLPPPPPPLLLLLLLPRGRVASCPLTRRADVTKPECHQRNYSAAFPRLFMPHEYVVVVSLHPRWLPAVSSARVRAPLRLPRSSSLQFATRLPATQRLGDLTPGPLLNPAHRLLPLLVFTSLDPVVCIHRNDSRMELKPDDVMTDSRT